MSDNVYCSEGSDDFYFGYEQTDCPYLKENWPGQLWLDGWEETQHDAERKQALRPSFRMPVPIFGVKSSNAKRSE